MFLLHLRQAVIARLKMLHLEKGQLQVYSIVATRLAYALISHLNC